MTDILAALDEMRAHAGEAGTNFVPEASVFTNGSMKGSFSESRSQRPYMMSK